ncbi:hypothetical protein ElyMa_006208500 [Elysia marginata]|uniref:Uncharacterized protein n=1 Tax=Elysia marginata TaxID=1093978 RepID=A0AAV4H5E3_9GAST|nr:hypothetical protein ElyMa_006208500 [Elysia marginata]
MEAPGEDNNTRDGTLHPTKHSTVRTPIAQVSIRKEALALCPVEVAFVKRLSISVAPIKYNQGALGGQFQRPVGDACVLYREVTGWGGNDSVDDES